MRITALLLLMLTCGPAGPAGAQQQVPPRSLANLQEVFAGLRDGLWSATDTYWHRGEFDRCTAVMQLITEIDPHDVSAYDNGAWLMQNSFLDDEAEAFLRRGLANNADVYDLYFALGQFLYMHERHPEAIPLLRAAVTFDVPFFVWHQLAHASELNGEIGSALEIWLQREYIDPENYVPKLQIDRILRGDPLPNLPASTQRSREERRREEMAQ